jgi:uncharacterized membrane protein YheB (UPF0754 family)
LCVTLCVTVFEEDFARVGWPRKRFLKIASIPFVSIIFTFCHIWLALIMTFHPLEYMGVSWVRWEGQPIGLFGWQGIIPAKAAKMASMSVDLMTQKLLKVEEVFARLDPERVAEELEPALYSVMHQVIEEVALEHSPVVWEMLPEAVKAEVVTKAVEDSPPTIRAMMDEVRNNIEEVFDLKHMVVSALTNNKQLLVDMFQRCGWKELEFIKVLGAYLGFFFGLIQMIIWVYYEAMWVLPVTGFLVGYLTNWLALKMIFEPVEPFHITICGWRLLTIHGLFLQRQSEVAAEYGRMVTTDVLTTRKILAAMLSGPRSDNLFELVHRHVQTAVDDFSSVAKPFVQMSIGVNEYRQSKRRMGERLIAVMPDVLLNMEDYATSALDLETTLREKMCLLSSAEFERLLHPVFEEDEFKLIIIGGLLGVAVGFGQYYGLGG